VKSFARNLREFRTVVKGGFGTDHPIMAHIIPIRRCNLSCTYCNEYDDFSPPVPKDVMISRINRLADLGTSILTLSGGEPMLHPDLDEIIAAMRRRGVIAGMITNGYMLMPDRIKRLNQAGLDHMQISIDNVMPDDVSKKSLKVLDKKLQMLSEHAEFHVNINSVVGGGIHDPNDALVVGKRAIELGFSATVGIIHDGDGQLRPLGDRERAVYHEMKSMENRHFARLNFFQDAIAQGKQLAMPRRSPLHVHLRGRLGPLLLPAARLPRHAFGKVHRGRHPPRIPDRKILRPLLHRQLRPLRLLLRLLARQTNHPPGSPRTAPRQTHKNPIRKVIGGLSSLAVDAHGAVLLPDLRSRAPRVLHRWQPVTIYG
jgi:hypothetical protein